LAIPIPEPEPEIAALPTAETPQPKPLKRSFWLGLSADALGAGFLIHGLIENDNMANRAASREFRQADTHKKNRNNAYLIGTAILLGGISIHIFF
jgi:hypothetical protein